MFFYWNLVKTLKRSLRVHKRFRELRPDLIPKQMHEEDAVVVPVPYESLEKLPELRVVLSNKSYILQRRI